MKISDHKLDTLIRAASDELLEEDVNYAKSLDTSTTQISDKAIRRIRRNIKNYDKEPWWNSIPFSCRKIVAAMLVLCTISFGMCLSVTAVRAEIAHTILEWYDKFVSVFYVTDETPPSTIEDYKEPLLMLAGTEKQVIEQNLANYFIIYCSDELPCLTYQQMIIDSMVKLDNEKCTVSEITINGFDAQLFDYDDGSLVVTWSDGQYAYIISMDLSDIESDLLISIAESVN